MELRAVPYDEARPLTAALAQEMSDRYGGGEEGPAHPEQFLPPYGVFLVLTREGRDVACGGLRQADERSRCYSLVLCAPG